MNPVERAEALLAEAQLLHQDAQAAIATMTLTEARRLVEVAREVEDWMKSIRLVVGVE